MPNLTNLTDLTARLIEFRDARDWRQFHGLKNLMLSLNLEAAELAPVTRVAGDAHEVGVDHAHEIGVGSHLDRLARAGLDAAQAFPAPVRLLLNAFMRSVSSFVRSCG